MGDWTGGGNQDKSQNSETKDNKVSVNEGNAYGGEGNVFNLTDGEAFSTVKEVLTHAIDKSVEQRVIDNSLIKSFADSNSRIADSTTQAVAKLAETRLTDGDNIKLKNMAVIIGIAGAALVLPSLLKK